MDYIDSGFLNAIRSTPIPDYVGDFSRGYSLVNKIYDDRRQRELENYKMMLQERQQAAQEARLAQQQKMQEMLQPYKIQEMQLRLAGLQKALNKPEPDPNAALGIFHEFNQRHGIGGDTGTAQAASTATVNPDDISPDAPAEPVYPIGQNLNFGSINPVPSLLQ